MNKRKNNYGQRWISCFDKQRVVRFGLAMSLVFSTNSLVAYADETKNDNPPAPAVDAPHPGGVQSGRLIELPGRIPLITWSDAVSKPTSIVLAIHGLGMNKESYEKLAGQLARNNVGTYALDVRGFGAWKNAGAGNDKVDFEQTLVDIKQSLDYMHNSHPGVPVYLLGESMGGALALQATARYPESLKGVVSSVPAGNSKYTIPTALKVALIGLFRGPNAEVDIGKDVVEKATTKPGLERKILSDPRNRRKLSVKEIAAFRKMIANNKVSATEIRRTPVLIVQGYRDKLVSPKGTIKLYNKVKNTDKNMLLVGQKEHFVLEEGQANDFVMDNLVKWFERKANAPIQSASSVEVIQAQ